jgi:hypothetical protein
MDEWMNGWMDGWMDEDEWMDCTYRCDWYKSRLIEILLYLLSFDDDIPYIVYTRQY